MNDTDANDCPTSVDNVMIGYDAGGGTWTTNDSNSNVGVGNYVMDAAMNGAVNNTAVGHNAMSGITTGGYNTCVGSEAGNALAGASGATCIGQGAGDLIQNADNNTCVGQDSGNVITTGGNNTIIGAGADASANDGTEQTVLGKGAIGVSDYSVTLGAANVTDVYMAQDKQALVHCRGLVIPAPLAEDDTAYEGADKIITNWTGDRQNVDYDNQLRITLTMGDTSGLTRFTKALIYVMRVYHETDGWNHLSGVYKIDATVGGTSSGYLAALTTSVLYTAATSGGWTLLQTSDVAQHSQSQTSYAIDIDNPGSGSNRFSVYIPYAHNVTAIALTEHGA
jgi:hypothetical protein